MIVLTIPGTPIAKKRPRFAVRNGKGHVYDDQGTDEGRLLWELRQQYKGIPIDAPAFVEMEFCFEPPKSASKKVRAAMLSGEIEHTKKPDIDNLVKFYFDVMNGTTWIDDCQVARAVVSKRYAEKAQTIITIKVLGVNPERTQPTDF